MKLPKSKFVLLVDSRGIHLVEGKLPTRDQQLWDGETTKGTKCQAVFNDNLGITFYHN